MVAWVERQAHYEAGKIVGLAHVITHDERAVPELDDVGLVRKQIKRIERNERNERDPTTAP